MQTPKQIMQTTQQNTQQNKGKTIYQKNVQKMEKRINEVHRIYMVLLLCIFIFFVILDYIIAMETENKIKYFIILFITSIVIAGMIYKFYIEIEMNKYKNLHYWTTKPSKFVVKELKKIYRRAK